MAAVRFSTVFALYKRRKLLRARQVKVEERQALKFRMKKNKTTKGSNLSAAALKRFQRVCRGHGCFCACPQLLFTLVASGNGRFRMYSSFRAVPRSKRLAARRGVASSQRESSNAGSRSTNRLTTFTRALAVCTPCRAFEVAFSPSCFWFVVLQRVHGAAVFVEREAHHVEQ